MLIQIFEVMGQEALKRSLLRYSNVGLLRDMREKGLSKVLIQALEGIKSGRRNEPVGRSHVSARKNDAVGDAVTI